MPIIHFSQGQLAERWGIGESTLEHWRSEGQGPAYLKLGGRVVYREKDIESFEESCLRQPLGVREEPDKSYEK